MLLFLMDYFQLFITKVYNIWILYPKIELQRFWKNNIA